MYGGLLVDSFKILRNVLRRVWYAYPHALPQKLVAAPASPEHERATLIPPTLGSLAKVWAGG